MVNKKKGATTPYLPLGCCQVNAHRTQTIAHLPLLSMDNANTTGHLSFYHHCIANPHCVICDKDAPLQL